MRSNKQTPKYKFSITNLVLVNDVYPSDFFLRIKALNSQEPQDSPIIPAHQTQCEEVFPWEFAVQTLQIKMQFVQISNNSRVQIVRSQQLIEGLTDQDGEPVALLANRTGKKLCIVTYKLQPYSPPKNVEKQSPKSRVQNKKPYRKQPVEESPSSKQKKVIMSKQEHDELSRQIANINKSIQKILDNQKSEHALFSKYLDQSTSFIKQMMNQSKDSRVNANDDSSKIQQASEQMQEQQEEPSNTANILKQIQQKQENQQPQNSKVSSKDEPTSKKWYQQKYKKDQPQISSNKDFRRPRKNVLSEPVLEYSQNPENNHQNDQSSLILSNLSFNTEILPQQVVFSEPGSKSPFLKMKAPNQGMHQWKKIIEIPLSPLIVVTVDDQKKKRLQGCIAKKQLEKNIVYLYDQKGQQKGFLRFKQKILQIYSVQTQELLSLNKKPYDNDYEDQNNENEKTQDSPKQKTKQQVFAANPRKSTRLRKMSQQQRSNQSRNSLKQQMQNKQESRSPKAKSNRIDLESNSVSASYLPFIKKSKASQREQYHTQAYASDSEPSQINSTQFLSRIKLVNLKINTISVKLSKNNSSEFIGKFIRMSMRNKHPINTEIINLSQNLTWKGKGYVFDSVSPYSQLKIELCNNEENGPKVIGTAKICLALLNLQKQNNIQFYHQFVRDQKQNQIGELILGYQSIDKNRRSQSAQRIIDQEDGFHEDSIYDNLQTSKEQKRRKLKSKSKSKSRNKSHNPDPEPTHRTDQKNNNNIGNTSSQAKSLVGSASVIRTRKYTGGNIIIGRAARFRFKQQQKPGPGEYEVPSYFEKHVSPL